MNRRNKGLSKKIEFEPKIPQDPIDLPPKPEDMNNKKEESSQETELIQQIKGVLAPRTFSESKEFNIDTHSFIMNLPDQFNNCSLVVFKDNTLGIRMNGVVYECDASHIGDGMVVEVGNSVRKLNGCDFVLTAYNYEKK